jgi:hypothetical protein
MAGLIRELGQLVELQSNGPQFLGRALDGSQFFAE